MVEAIGASKTSTNLPIYRSSESSATEMPLPAFVASDVGEALALFIVKIGREQRDAARTLRESAESMTHAAQREQQDSMRSQAGAELAAGFAGAAGSFAEAGVSLKSASIKQSVADKHAPLLDAKSALAKADPTQSHGVGNDAMIEAHAAHERAEEQSAPKLERLKALSAGIAGSTRMFEASFGALASHEKAHVVEAEQRAGEMSRRIDTLRNEERDAQALINAGVDALKSYAQRIHEMRTAAIFR